MTFPLKDWIDRHHGLPHDLGRSGMPVRMPSVAAALDRPAEPDDEALRSELAAIHGVARERLFLTHGATEGNFLALSYLARRGPSSPGGRPRCAVGAPEYPPISEIARSAGFDVVAAGQPADVGAASRPNNPTGGTGVPAFDQGNRAGPIVVDETFRGFTELPSLVNSPSRPTWVVGSFTKLYGADELRVGFVIPPPGETDGFAGFHGHVTDEIPPHSVAGARAILRDRGAVLAEVRQRFETNRAALREQLDPPELPSGPVFFDRPTSHQSTDALADACLADGVLVCPGHYFGDPTGVRVTLTAPTFPDDLAAYIRVRTRWLGR